MKPLDYPLLTDENVHPETVKRLSALGKNVTSVVSVGLSGAEDVDVLRHAHAEGRVVVTHDSDFGTLAIRSDEPHSGIVYLRPGHIEPEFVMRLLEALDASDVDVEPGFLIVAERRGDAVRTRLRRRL